MEILTTFTTEKLEIEREETYETRFCVHSRSRLTSLAS
jgi:hypothetical protein